MYLSRRKYPTTPSLESGAAIPGNNAGGGGGGGMNAGMFSTIAQVGSQGIDMAFKPTQLKQGVSYEKVGAATAKGTLKGAAKGAAIGSVVPGIGTAVGAVAGAVVGGVTSYLGAKKKKEEALKLEKHLEYRAQRAGADQINAYSQNTYGNMATYQGTAYAKKGGRMFPSFSNINVGDKPTFQRAEEGAVILKGQRHHEEGSFGKGNPGIDEMGQKVVEVEANEMLLTDKQTQEIERMVSRYNQDPDTVSLVDLGKFVQRVVRNAS